MDCENAAHHSSRRGNEAFNQSTACKNGRKEILQNDSTDCLKISNRNRTKQPWVFERQTEREKIVILKS